MSSVKKSSFKCANCDDQSLETFSLDEGKLERCPACHWFLADRELLAKFSPDKEACMSAFAEPRLLRLSTHKQCPRCFDFLWDGRVRTRQANLMECPSCKGLWSDFAALQKFEEAIEVGLQGAVERALYPDSDLRLGSPGPEAPLRGAIPRPPRKEPEAPDQGFGKWLRGAARSLDDWADRMSGNQPTQPAPKPTPPAPKPATPPAQKPPPSTVKMPQPKTPAPVEPAAASASEVPEPTQQTESVIEQKAPEPVAETPPAPPPVEPVIEPKAPEPVVEAPPAPPPAEREPAKTTTSLPDELLAALSEEPILEKEKVPLPEPIKEPIELPQESLPPVVTTPEPEKPSAPAPIQKQAEPEAPPKPAPVPEPAPPPPEPKPEPKVAPQAPPPEIKPLPTPPKKIPEPVPEPVKGPAPFVKGPAPLGKKKKTPAPKAEKEPKEPAEPKEPKVPKTPKEKKEKGPARWPSRAFSSLTFLFPLVGIGMNVASEEGFEAGIAASWMFLGWSLARLLQLLKLYPWKKFAETSVADLEGRTDVQGWTSLPVVVTGDVVIPDAVRPKNLAISDGTQSIALDRYGAFEVMPKLFGITGLNRFANQKVTVRGWYRRRAGVATIEVREISAEKKSQRALVREIRWGCTIALLLLVIVLMLSGD